MTLDQTKLILSLCNLDSFPGKVFTIAEHRAEVALQGELGEVGLKDRESGDNSQTRTTPGTDPSVAAGCEVVEGGDVHTLPLHRLLDRLVVGEHPELLQHDQVVVPICDQAPYGSHPFLLVIGTEGVRDAPGVEGHHPQAHHILPVEPVACTDKQETD